MVEVVKKAEEGSAAILRLYECYNRRTDSMLTFGKEIASIRECNMMEDGNEPVNFKGKDAFFTIKPYEIKTFKVIFK